MFTRYTKHLVSRIRQLPRVRQMEKHPVWVALTKRWAQSQLGYQFLKSVTTSAFLAFLLGTLVYYNFFCQPGDVFYNPPILKTNTPAVLYWPFELMPNLLQAIGEVCCKVDHYGILDEKQFSEALSTQLRRNFMFRLMYLRLRIRVWNPFRRNREQDGVPLDYNPHKSRYNIFSFNGSENDEEG